MEAVKDTVESERKVIHFIEDTDEHEGATLVHYSESYQLDTSKYLSQEAYKTESMLPPGSK